MIKPKQLSFNDIYAGCLESFENEKPNFFLCWKNTLILMPLSHWVLKCISEIILEDPYPKKKSSYLPRNRSWNRRMGRYLQNTRDCREIHQPL